LPDKGIRERFYSPNRSRRNASISVLAGSRPRCSIYCRTRKRESPNPERLPQRILPRVFSTR